MSIRSNLIDTINRSGQLSFEQKRIFREVVRQVLGDTPAVANQASATFQSTAGLYKVSIQEVGDLVYTRILLDLTGLRSGDAGDVIGPSAAAAAVFKVTAAECGTVLGGFMRTLETPATGDDDIDVVISATGTTVEDAAPDTETVLLNSGNIAAGDLDSLAAFDMAKPFIYLVGATGADAAYTAGQVEITLIGYRA